jgi:hypothetical protein
MAQDSNLSPSSSSLSGIIAMYPGARCFVVFPVGSRFVLHTSAWSSSGREFKDCQHVGSSRGGLQGPLQPSMVR